MLSVAQQHAIDRFAKSLLALSDDALIDTYHQAAIGQLGSKVATTSAKPTLATEQAMRDRFLDYRTRYKLRYP